MKFPSLHKGQPVNHAGRLEALRDTGLLDAAPDESFDRFTRLASRLLGAEISLVSLVDEDRQFFISHFGLPEPFASSRQTCIGRSLCRRVVENGSPLIIEDARTDPRCASNPIVLEDGIIAYLGIPLTTRDGLVLGSLCAVETRPRIWTREDHETLSDLAVAVMREIELREHLNLLKDSADDSEAMAASRQQHLRMIVHDLRSPASAAASCIDLLKLDAASLSEEHVQLIELGQESISQVLSMIHDLLEAGQPPTGIEAPVFEVITASKLIRHATRLVQPIASFSRIPLIVELPEELIFIKVDRKKSERLLLNLLTNALKFSPAESPICVNLELARDSDPPMCRITVSDCGPGVPDEEKSRIFEDSVTGSQPSTRGPTSFGLGLAFCRLVTATQGGRIDVIDRIGGGSDFRVTFPLAEPPPFGQ